MADILVDRRSFVITGVTTTYTTDVYVMRGDTFECWEAAGGAYVIKMVADRDSPPPNAVAAGNAELPVAAAATPYWTEIPKSGRIRVQFKSASGTVAIHGKTA